jgi:CBS domain containing-hemolysin-like protein
MKFPRNLFKRKTATEKLVDSDSFTELNLEKKDMIRGIVELSETAVKEVMVPRIDVVFLAEDVGRDELFRVITETGHSRFPVYKGTIDNVVGILYVKDTMTFVIKNSPVDLREITRKAYFVPETMKLDALLREFRQRRIHIAIVVDEYGGVSGIVSMEDILEEIVGDIQDEFDDEQDDVLKVGDNIFLCDARVNIEDLNEKLGLDIPDEEYDTLGGFVFELFGKIPVRFEKIRYDNLEFIIQNVDGHKIKTVKVVVNEKQGETEK